MIVTKNQYILDNYQRVRPLLRTGDVVAFEGTGAFSKGIMYMTRREGYQPTSHVGVVVVFKEYDRVMIAESQEGLGVRLIRLSKYLTNYDNQGNPYKGAVSVYRHKEYEHNAVLEQDLVKFIFDTQGRSYSMRQIGSLAFRLITKKTPVRQREQVEAYICSEYALDVCLPKLKLYIPKDNPNQISLPCDATGPMFNLIAILKDKS